MSYKNNTVTVKETILDKKNWLYCNSEIDGEWHSLLQNLERSKDKYLQHVPDRGVVVTAGGHIGMYAYFFAQHFKQVYAFEPDSLNFHCMVNNNQLDNVVKIQAALGDEHRLVNIGFGRDGTRQSYKVQDNRILEGNFEAKTEPYIPLLKIDDLNLPKCDLIQLDIEDYEYFALKGAEETLRRCKPTLILENGTGSYIVDFLKNYGYKQVDQIDYDTIYTFNDTQWKIIF